MKKIVFLTILVLGAVITNANNGDGKVEKKAKITNYKAVLGDIQYPEHCRASGKEGTVLLEVKIGLQGELLEHKIVETPCMHLSKTVEDVVNQLEFSPAIGTDESAVVSKLRIPVNFKLNY